MISIVPKQSFQQLQRIRKQLRNFKLLAINYGQWGTIRDWNSINSEGEPIPWYTYPATEFLSHLDFKAFRVFEYGSGNSTIWWSKRAKQVTAVEDSELWFSRIKIFLEKSNVSYFLEKDRQKYISMANGEYEIFVIDGEHRRDCLAHIVKLGGVMVILDNSDWYPKSIQFMRENLGWVQTDFHGFGPINNYTWTTSVFINPARYKELSYIKALNSTSGTNQKASDEY